jgi:excisionase family DNA binding protein
VANNKYIAGTEVARLLGVHRNTVAKMCSDGRLECEEWGSENRPWKRILKTSVQRFMEERITKDDQGS